MAQTNDDAEIKILCECCHSYTRRTLRWIKANTEFTCGCSATISLRADVFRQAIATIERDFAKYERAFARL